MVITHLYWIMAPLFRRVRRTTMDEFTEDRYGPAMGAVYIVFAVCCFIIETGGLLKGAGKVISKATGATAGVNDIVADTDAGGAPLAANDVIYAYKQLISRARWAGAAVHGATLTPFEGSRNWTPRGENLRSQVNSWIRSTTDFDSVIDFSRVLADPARPTCLDPLYDSGDHLHPGTAGYRALAQAVDLTALASLRG